MRKFLWSVLIGTCIILSSVHADAAKIENGKKVTFDYKLTIDGQLVESSEGKEPLEYTHGEGKIIPGLSSRLLGLSVGDEKTVVVPAKEAYGEINEDAYRELPKSSFPEGFEAKSGMVIELQSPGGGVVPAVIWEVKDETIVLNFNHPLAGKTLKFDIKIVNIK